MTLRVCIFAPSGTGKTAFVADCKGEYRGVKVIDFDSGGKGNIKPTAESLLAESGPTALLTASIEPPIVRGIEFLAVVPPESEMLANLGKRRANPKEADRTRNRPSHGLRRRSELMAYIREHKVRGFTGIKAALDSAIDEAVADGQLAASERSE